MSLRTVVSPPYLTTSFLSVCEPLYHYQAATRHFFCCVKPNVQCIVARASARESRF